MLSASGICSRGESSRTPSPTCTSNSEEEGCERQEPGAARGHTPRARDEAAKYRERRDRRELANSNERRRMENINRGFEALRKIVASGGEKISKAQILRRAAEMLRAQGARSERRNEPVQVVEPHMQYAHYFTYRPPAPYPVAWPAAADPTLPWATVPMHLDVDNTAQVMTTVIARKNELIESLEGQLERLRAEANASKVPDPQATKKSFAELVNVASAKYESESSPSPPMPRADQ